MPKTKQQKHDDVAVLTQKLQDAKSIVLTDYKGITMSQLSELRRELRALGAEFTVTKNNVLKIAFKNAALEASAEALEGPTATLFAFDDEITPIKALTKVLKTNQIGSVKGGLLNGEYMDQYLINKLSSLPSKDELRAKTVGILAAPLQGIVGVLNANLRNLVYVLSQINDKRQASGSMEV